MDRNSQLFKEGRRRLKEMLARARAEAKKTEGGSALQANSVLGQSVMSHIRESNLGALVVYEDGPGKWYGDLVLKGLPPGVPDILGTPTSTPRSSQKEALRDAYYILVGILRAIHERETTPREKPQEDQRVFRLYDFEFTLPGEAVDTVFGLSIVSDLAEDYSGDDALDFVRRKVEAITKGEELTDELLDTATEDQKAHLMAAMATALAHGEFSYPRRETSHPPEERERRIKPRVH
jgi:hypothetical protein